VLLSIKNFSTPVGALICGGNIWLWHGCRTILTSGFNPISLRYLSLKSLTLTLSEILWPSTWHDHLRQSLTSLYWKTNEHTPTNRWGRVKPIIIYGCSMALFTNALVWRGLKTPLCHCIASHTVSQGCHRPSTMMMFTKKDNYVKSHMYTQLQLYAEVEEFELKLWPKLWLDDWYDGDWLMHQQTRSVSFWTSVGRLLGSILSYNLKALRIHPTSGYIH